MIPGKCGTKEVICAEAQAVTLCFGLLAGRILDLTLSRAADFRSDTRVEASTVRRPNAPRAAGIRRDRGRTEPDQPRPRWEQTCRLYRGRLGELSLSAASPSTGRRMWVSALFVCLFAAIEEQKEEEPVSFLLLDRPIPARGQGFFLFFFSFSFFLLTLTARGRSWARD